MLYYMGWRIFSAALPGESPQLPRGLKGNALVHEVLQLRESYKDEIDLCFASKALLIK